MLWKVISSAAILTTSLMQFSSPRLMSDFPQGPGFPNDCFYVPDRESPLEPAVQDSIYVIPSIVSAHILERPQEPPLGWSSSSPLVVYTPGAYASALDPPFPDIASSSNPVTNDIPNMGRSNSIPQRIPHKKHKRGRRCAKSSGRASVSSSRQFLCPHPDCDETTTRKHDLKRHIETIHEGVKPFSCKFCSTSFSRKDAQAVNNLSIGRSYAVRDTNSTCIGNIGK